MSFIATVRSTAKILRREAKIKTLNVPIKEPSLDLKRYLFKKMLKVLGVLMIVQALITFKLVGL